MALAVFVLGGAACGKTAVILERYIGTMHLPGATRLRREPPRDGFSPHRHYDADRYKTTLPTYSSAIGDAIAVERFGDAELGGPSGPRTLAELARYPPGVQEEIKSLVESMGFDSLEQFAWEIVMDEHETGPVHFGRGLTHELSKFMAGAAFERQLEEGPSRGSVVWDATGNTDKYAYWIEMALDRGYDVEIVYVHATLPVALKRAQERDRQVPPDEVRRTHAKAAKVANDLEIMVSYHPDTYRMDFDAVNTSSPGEEAQALESGFGERPS